MHKIVPLLIASIVAPLTSYFGEVVIDPIEDDIGESLPVVFNTSFGRPDESGIGHFSGFSFSSKTIPSSSSIPESQLPEDYFYCQRYGPFSLENLEDVNVSFTYKLYSVVNQNIIERLRIFKNGTVISSQSKKAKSYTWGSRQTATFTLPIVWHWTSSGFEIHFEILNADDYSILKERSVSVYPPRNSVVSTYNLKHLLYKSNNIAFYGDGTNLVGYRETFDFRCMGDYIDNDYYYRLDISRNHFLYPNDIDITCQNVYLRFDDSIRLFPYLTHEANGEVILPLTLYETNNNEIHFKYKNSFYINKRTLEISSTYRTNYVLTEDFYLPINGLKKFNGTTIYLEFEGLGLDKIAGSLPLKYEINRTIVGSCNDGEYCVEGGVGQ